MKFWNKSQSDKQKNAPAERPAEQPVERPTAAFEQKLESVHFQARPEFRADLKARLMQSLADENLAGAAPGRAGRKAGFGSRLSLQRHLPSPARLALGGIGFAAALVLLISILSVGTLSGEKTASATAVAQQVPEVQPGSGNAGSSPTQLKSFFDPAEAAKTVGFAVNTPAYLPDGYKLEFASYSKPTTMAVAAPIAPAGSSGSTTQPALSFSGYLLRYTGPTANAPQLEIAQWQVPFKFDANSAPSLVQAGTVGGAGTGTGSGPVAVTGQSLKVATVSGTPAYIINGNQWSIQLASAQAIPISATANITAVAVPAKPGESGAVVVVPAEGSFSVATGPGDPSISFSQVGTASSTGPLTVSSSGVLIQFSTAATIQNVKTLVWQKDSVFTMVSSPGNLSDSDLKQIAESLKPAG